MPSPSPQPLIATEEKKRGAVSTIDKELSDMQVEKGKAFAEASSAKGEVTRIQSELSVKVKKITEGRRKGESATQGLSEAVEREKALITKKKGVLTDQDNFGKFMDDV